MYSPATEIKNYLMRNEGKVTELIHQFQNNSNKSNALIAQKKIQGLKLIAQGFTIFSCNGMKEDYIKTIKAEQQIRNFASSMQIKSIDPELLLGFCIKQQILAKQVFKIISRRLSRNVEYDYQLSTVCSNTVDDLKIEIDDSLDDEESNYSTLSKEEIKISGIEQEQNDSIELPNLQINKNDYNNDMIENENEEVRQYLYKLQKATTQLNHLHQRMKWSKPVFKESQSKINNVLFECKCQILIRVKNNNFIKLSSQCLGAVSKKQGRRIACLYLLKKIYNRLPDVWQKFQEIKKQNPGIQQPLNCNNELIFKKIIINEVKNLQKINLFQQQYKQPIVRQINQYLNRIKSCKNQMNLFIGQNKKVSPPQIQPEKQDQLSLWPIKITLYDDQTILVAKQRDASKKRAQQKCTKSLLFKLFQRNPARWRSFVDYKIKKKFQ